MYIEKIHEGKKKHTVHFAGAEPVALYPSEIRDFSVEEGESISDASYEELLGRVFQRGKERAYYLLGRREYSCTELRDKLYSEGYPLSIVGQIIAILYEYHYLDDERCGIHFVKGHNQKSRRELQMLLSQKGIGKDIQEWVFAQELDEEDNLRRLLFKKTGGQEVKKEDTPKLYRYCISHGYSYELVRKVLNSLGEEILDD